MTFLTNPFDVARGQMLRCPGGYCSGGRKIRAEDCTIPRRITRRIPHLPPMWVDAVIIPADAPNKDAALAFLNCTMDPKAIAAATDRTTCGNTGANAFVDKAVLDNPAVCPDAAVKSRISLPKAASPDYDAARLRAWQRIVTGG